MRGNIMNKILTVIKEILPYLLLFAAIFLVLQFVGQRTVVNGQSMESTLHNKENLLLDKISYRFSEPERFDIIVFPGVEEDGESPYYSKRISGMPGETVQIKDGAVYINGEKLDSDIYAKDGYTEEAGIAAEPVTVGPDEYFCLGDNRQNSRDSRFDVGMVKRSDIVGKVEYRFWPPENFGKLE